MRKLALQAWCLFLVLNAHGKRHEGDFCSSCSHSTCGISSLATVKKMYRPVCSRLHAQSVFCKPALQAYLLAAVQSKSM
jgi:hypothetical protein